LIPFLLLVLTFFVTSADAAVRSLALLTADGDSPSVALQVALAASIGVIATALLLFDDGGLVRTAAVVTGGPFAVLGLLGVGGLIVAVRRNDQ
jgi:glycine betaine transporter